MAEVHGMKSYPSKELCLQMAKIQFEQRNESLMWAWLVTWAFHEMYIEGWIK